MQYLGIPWIYLCLLGGDSKELQGQLGSYLEPVVQVTSKPGRLTFHTFFILSLSFSTFFCISLLFLLCISHIPDFLKYFFNFLDFFELFALGLTLFLTCSTFWCLFRPFSGLFPTLYCLFTLGNESKVVPSSAAYDQVATKFSKSKLLCYYLMIFDKHDYYHVEALMLSLEVYH